MWISPGIEGRKACGRAFTLVEILVSTAILALVVALLGSVITAVGSAWIRTAGQNERSLSARAIADYIHTDLKTALLPMVASATDNLQFVLNPSDLDSEDKVADALFWQAPVATGSEFGDIAEVGYFVKWDASQDPPKPILCRFFVNAAMNDAHFKIYSAPGSWLSVVDAVAPGTAPDYQGLFAENVVAIWFRCLDGNGQAFPGRTFDSRVGEPSTFEKDGDGNHLLRRLPSAVQVSFVMLDSRAAARLTAAHQVTLTSLAGTVADDIAGGTPNDKTVSPAEAFVSAAVKKPELRAIASSLAPYTTTVHLVHAQ